MVTSFKSRNIIDVVMKYMKIRILKSSLAWKQQTWNTPNPQILLCSHLRYNMPFKAQVQKVGTTPSFPTPSADIIESWMMVQRKLVGLPKPSSWEETLPKQLPKVLKFLYVISLGFYLWELITRIPLKMQKYFYLYWTSPFPIFLLLLADYS